MLSRKESGEIVDEFFNIIKKSLKDGDDVKIKGFGKFTLRKRKGQKTNRNVKFNPSPSLKDDINARYAHRINEDGIEDISIPPREGTSRALKFFLSKSKEDI